MQIIKLYTDFNIPIKTEGNNCSPGWVNTKCPFCDDPSEHLGYDLELNYFRCWRCGRKNFVDTIARLLRVPFPQAKQIVLQYKGQSTLNKKEKIKLRFKAFKYPSGIATMTKQHRQYLMSRGFHPDTLERQWGLLGTPVVSSLDGIDYKNRIIAPIMWNGKVVSFQGRRISDNKQQIRYKTCSKERELIHHKHILYGKQAEWDDIGICVEGITDVWRLGYKAFATFGIEFTLQQVKAIANHFKKVFVLFDNGIQEDKQAHKLISELRLKGIEAKRIYTHDSKDPGSLTPEEAEELLALVKEK